jgi:hypothetical protein
MYLIEDKEEKITESVHTPCRVWGGYAQAGGGQFSAEFRAAFKLVAEHYGCSPEEIELMKAAVKRDPENAVRCFMAMEALILGDAKGINERIRATLESKLVK